MSVSIYYSPCYDLDLGGLEANHPFDVRKAGRALARLRNHIGDAQVTAALRQVTEEAAHELLTLAHAPTYLDGLSDPATVAQALEVPALYALPGNFIDQRILRPMRMAVQGTLDAMRAVLGGGIAVNLAGGYHHASHNRGEGFCLYADVIIALRALLRDGEIGPDAPVLYIDLDAHQGNGICRLCQFYGLDNVTILDMYNRDIYPNDTVAAERIDIDIGLKHGTGDEEYLTTLTSILPSAFSISPKLVIYNAGTDIVIGDPLGDLGVSSDGVATRDQLVIDACRQRGLPLLIVPSGGYTDMSHQMIEAMLGYLLTTDDVASGAEGSVA